MGFFGRLWNTVARREALADEVGEELRFHIDERARQYEAAGMSPAEARRRAAAKFGGAARMREEARDADVLGAVDGWVRDAAIAVRGLRRRPGMVAAVAGSLALGIGLNSSVFSVVDAVLLRPLPFPQSSEAFTLDESLDGHGVGGNPARFRHWREQATALTALAGFYGDGAVMTGRGSPQRVTIGFTFGSPLALLGTQPAIGRGFGDSEEGVVLATHRFWKNQLGGDLGIAGTSLRLGKKSYTVIGVLPPALGYPAGIDLLAPAPVEFQKSTGNWFGVAARLSAGASREQAQAQLATLAARFAREHPESAKGLAVRLLPLQAAGSAEARQPLLLLMGVVAFVLLIACLNIASLLIARASERSRETAIRASLGGGRLSLIRLFLMESMWLALLGGGLGICAAYWGVDLLKALLPAGTPRLDDIAVNGRVLLFTVVSTIACGLLFGLLPALQATSAHALGMLREGRGTVNPRGRQRTRRLLVAAQAGLSMILLVGATLALQGFAAMRGQAAGYRADGRLAVSIHFPWDTPEEKLREFDTRVLEELARLPGVRRVGLTDRLPLEGESQSGQIAIDGLALPDALSKAPVDMRTVSAGYFAAIGAPLLRGRFFEDRPKGALEVVVNQAFASRYPPEAGDLIGRRFKLGRGTDFAEIVGIVGNLRRSPSEERANPAVYLSYLRGFWPLGEFVLDAAGPRETLAAAVRAAVKNVDPNQPIQAIRTLEASRDEAMSSPRVQASLLAAFAGGALLLAVLGLYGLLSSDVAQRTQEIGVRLALGASRSEVVKLLVRQGTSIAAGGLAAGLAGTVALSRWLGSELSGLAPLSWTAPALAAAVLIAAAFVASLAPARRAASVDPAVALRRE